MRMEVGMDRKIFVPVDGSIYSFNALSYLSYLFTDLEGIHVHLHCVVPAGPLPVAKEWMNELDLMSSISPQARKRMVAAKRFMEEAVLQLGRRGIAPKQVSTCVALSQRDVAGDIMYEARKGNYDALVIGRRGVGKIEEMVMGISVSAAVTGKCYDMPIWVVDGRVNSRRFLLPVDETFNSLKAADHLGFILQDNPYTEINLFHFAATFGAEKNADRASLNDKWGEEWCGKHLDRADSVYHAPEQMLVERGVSPTKIHRLEEQKGIGASKHIIQQSVLHGQGTIVIGRRDKCVRKGLFKGVSDKLLAIARHLAICVVG